ncbi:major facilitator superfamily domain-containing protein 9-like [Spodoptera litura]|uniref:Major facilitator superfamily domain-containing protein 9-like n=1 Tax=Spodoptera litura TaxID=69820 RepID=A0A9J7ISH8_SPOLT|nr:major facilitator superfamily domain-containing protein 9-like [Spodoptera litura]
MVSPYATFLLVCFLDLVSVSFIVPYLDIHVKELGFSYIQTGLVWVVYPLCQIVSSPVIGSLGDVTSRKQLLLICIFICSCAYFWLGIASSLYVFLSLRIVLGIFKQTQILTRALAPEYIHEPSKVSILYGKLLSLGSFGQTLGSFLSSYPIETYPRSGFTFMCGVLSIFFGINAALINALPETKTKEEEKPDTSERKSSPIASVVTTYKHTCNTLYNVNWLSLWDILLFKLLMSISTGLYYNNFRIYLKTEYDISNVSIVCILLFEAIIASIVNNSVAFINKLYINDRDYSQRVFHTFLGIVLTLVALGMVSSFPLYVLLLVPKAVSFALARIVTLAVVMSRSSPSNRGTLIGALYSASSIAYIVTPIIGGLIIQYLGISYMYFVASLFAATGLVISQMRTRFVKQKIK